MLVEIRASIVEFAGGRISTLAAGNSTSSATHTQTIEGDLLRRGQRGRFKIVRRENMEHTTSARADVTGNARHALSVVARMIRAIRRAVETARARRHLEALPDYMLRDMGIGRSEIGSAVRFGRPRSAQEDIMDAYAMLFDGPRRSGQMQTRI